MLGELYRVSIEGAPLLHFPLRTVLQLQIQRPECDFMVHQLVIAITQHVNTSICAQTNLCCSHIRCSPTCLSPFLLQTHFPVRRWAAQRQTDRHLRSHLQIQFELIVQPCKLHTEIPRITIKPMTLFAVARVHIFFLKMQPAEKPETNLAQEF